MSERTTSDSSIFKRTLPNGMTVLLREDHRAPVAALQMWVNTGSAFEQEYAGTGVSHFLEHMLFKGTAKRGVGQIAQDIQSYGGDINAYTSYEATVFAINIESGQFFHALEILADAIMHSSFDPEEFKKEQEVIIKEINMNDDDPERYVSRLFWATAYAEHPAKHPVIGYEELFRKLTRDDVLRYYKTRYVPNNMVLVAAGDFSAEKAYAEIEKLFRDFPRGIWNTPMLPAEPRQLSPRRITEHRDLGQAYALVGFHGPSMSDPDMPVMDVLSIILGEGKSSRLYQEAREKQQLVTSIASWSYTPSFPGVFGVWASLDPKHLDALLSLIWKQLEALKATPVREAELEKAKAQTLHEYYASLESMSGQASDLGSSETMTHDPSFSKAYVRQVSEVRAADIQRVAKKYFQQECSNEVFLLPKDSKIASKVAPEKAAKEPRITKHVLNNGVRVLIRQDPSVPTVSIKALFKGGLLCESKKDNGISNLFSEILIQGTTKRSGEIIVEDLEKAGGQIGSFSGNNSFGFSIDVLAERWQWAVDLLGEIILEPAFPEQIFQKEKQAALLDIQSLEDQVFQTASKLFRETLFAGHPYQFVPQGSKDSVSGLNREDLLRFYREFVVGPNTVISVYGDVQEAKVLAALEVGLAKLSNRPAPFPVIVRPALHEAKKVTKTQDGKQAIILLGYPSVDMYDKDRYTFEVMDALFSGLGSRVFSAIRETHGLAYLVGCYQLLGVEPGAFVFYVGTVPESVDFVVVELQKEIAKIKKHGVTSEELERGKRGLIGGRKIQLQTNAQLSAVTGMDELYGLGWDDYKKYYERINAVTLEDIRRVANAYFDDKRCVLSIVQPPVAKKASRR